jgi:hypothetical protein
MVIPTVPFALVITTLSPAVDAQSPPAQAYAGLWCGKARASALALQLSLAADGSGQVIAAGQGNERIERFEATRTGFKVRFANNWGLLDLERRPDGRLSGRGEFGTYKDKVEFEKSTRATCA